MRRTYDVTLTVRTDARSYAEAIEQIERRVTTVDQSNNLLNAPTVVEVKHAALSKKGR